MVEDQASRTRRDVDVTVTVDTVEGKYAFKGYEVKHWRKPLDVADVEALAAKLNDMPSVTHRAIVATSGYTAPAIKKAEHHCWASIRLHTEWSLKAIVSIPRSLPLFVVGEEGVKVESPQRSEENRP